MGKCSKQSNAWQTENVKVLYSNDEATSEDHLNREQYAAAFAKLAESCETPLVVGLYGSWGVGKTSLMKIIEKKLDKQKTRSVWFDPFYPLLRGLATQHLLCQDWLWVSPVLARVLVRACVRRGPRRAS